jgi:hypothetical protein
VAFSYRTKYDDAVKISSFAGGVHAHINAEWLEFGHKPF